MRSKIETLKTMPSAPTGKTYVLSTLLTTVLSAGFTTMLTTTYEFEFQLPFFLVVVLLLSFFSTLLHIKTEKRKWISPLLILLTPILIFALIYLDMMDTGEGLSHLMYNLKQYSFRQLDMEFDELREPEYAITMLMIAMNLLPVMVTTWVITRRKNVVFSILSYLPFFGCSVALNYMFPSQASSVLTIGAVMLLILFQSFRKTDRNTCEKRILLAVLPVLILTVALGVIYPKQNYDKQELAAKQMSFVRSLIVKGSQNKTMQDIAKGVQGIPGANNAFEKASNTYMGSVVMNSVASGIAVANTRSENLMAVGNFDPPVFSIMKVHRTVNPSARSVSAGPSESAYLYIKSTSMDVYSGQAWEVSYYEPDYDRIYREDVMELPRKEADYIVQMDLSLTADINFIPLYVDGSVISGDISSRIEVQDVYNIRQQVPATGAWTYTYAASDIPVRRPDAGKLWSEAYMEYVAGDCLDVPAETRNAILESGKLPQWFLDVMNGDLEMSDLEKVRAVTDFVSNLHPYDEHTDYPPSDADFVPWFLTEARTGFCVHYASTAVILLRMLNVPARYCSGYMVNTLRGNESAAVYSTDAHAWFEFFHPEYGWVMGDATPGNAHAASYFDVNAIMQAMGIEAEELPNSGTTNPFGITVTPSVTKNPDGTTTSPFSHENENTNTPSPTGKSKGTGTTRDSDDGSGGGFSLPHPPKYVIYVLLGILLLVALRLGYSRFWKKQMNDTDRNRSARAYFRYFSMMSRKWRSRPSSRAYFIAQKAAFSAEGISDDELQMLIRSGKNALAGVKKKQPWYRRLPVSLLWEVKI